MAAMRKSAGKGDSVIEIDTPSAVRGAIDLDRYGGQWIAILRRRIVDHDKDLEKLWKRLERKGLEETAEFMLVPPPGAAPV
jgi:hypothetical protein